MICNRPSSLPETRLAYFEYKESYDDLQKKIEYAIVQDGCIEKRGKKSILSVPITFDIETTTLPVGHKYNPYEYMIAFPYLYQCYVCGTVYFLRSRIDCYMFFSEIERICIKNEIQIICYVHNLSFEYQFMKSILDIDFEKVFLVKNRKVAKFELKSDTIIFRDSYLLSNMSLQKFCENYNEPLYQKDKELIDYEVPRYPWDELTEEILYYSGMDVITLYYAIENIMLKEGDDLKSIPMTNTGYVRRSYKKACLGNTKHKGADRKNSKAEYEKGKSYRAKYITKSALTLDQYNLLLKAFRGGNTHASRYKAGILLENVTSYDFASSYPAVMIASDEFPIGKLMDCTKSLQTESDIQYYIKNYWVIFDCMFEDIELRDNETTPVPYIPKSKVITTKYDGIYDNGRIISQHTAFNYSFLGCEYNIIKKQYKGKMKIIKAYYCTKSYLPLQIRKECFNWYKKKTELKNVTGMEYEYMRSKNRVNSSFGMMVEKIIKDVQTINDKGEISLRKPTEDEQEEQLANYYSVRSAKFLAYQWGVTVTALARVRLQELIDMTATDFIYADTDSVKILNGEKYKKQIEEYNKSWIAYAEKSGVEFRAFTKDNEEQILGLADFDAYYNKFITLGAKKYAYEDKKGLHITIAGVPKKLGAKLLGDISKFKEGMIFYIGADGNLEDRQSWKKRLLYNDEANFDIKVENHTLHIGSYIAMERTPYELSITDEYRELISSEQEIFEKDDIWY